MEGEEGIKEKIQEKFLELRPQKSPYKKIHWVPSIWKWMKYWKINEKRLKRRLSNMRFQYPGSEKALKAFKLQVNNSLVVQWLGLHRLTANGLVLTSGQGTKIPQAAPCNHK